VKGICCLAATPLSDKDHVDRATLEHGDVVALRSALASLPPTAYGADQQSLGSLHERLCAVVDLLKAEGLPPERVLLAIKGIAYEAKMGASAAILVERMVTWCLEQYFKAS